MTLEQQLSGPVLKTKEQELIELIANKNIVIKIENPKQRFIKYITNLTRDSNATAKICYCEKRLDGSYVEALLWAYTREVDELIIINNTINNYLPEQKWIKRKIKRAKQDGIVKQTIKIQEKKYNYKSCPITIIDFNY